MYFRPAALVLILSGCDRDTPAAERPTPPTIVESVRWNLRYAQPSGWANRDRVEGPVIARFVSPDQTAAGECAVDPSPLPLVAYFDRFAAMYGIPGVHVPVVLKRQVVGNVLTAEFTNRMTSSPTQCLVRIIDSGGRKYRLVLYSPQDRFDQFRPLFESLLDEFQLLHSESPARPLR